MSAHVEGKNVVNKEEIEEKVKSDWAIALEPIYKRLKALEEGNEVKKPTRKKKK